jgi:hypothetical protein
MTKKMVLPEVDCEICAFAKIHACWPHDHKGTHCRECHASWTGTRPGHCVVCHQTFAGDTASEAHWDGARHVHPVEVENLELRDDGFWSIKVLESV